MLAKLKAAIGGAGVTLILGFMDLDSAMMIISLLAIGLIAVWTEWWNAVLMKAGTPRYARIAGVLVLSLATLFLVHVGPWVVMSIDHGALATNLADPTLPLAVLVVFVPAVAYQIVLALFFAMRHEDVSV